MFQFCVPSARSLHESHAYMCRFWPCVTVRLSVLIVGIARGLRFRLSRDSTRWNVFPWHDCS